MLVVAVKFGQLGNRLLAFSNLIATAKQYDFTVINPAFEEYAQFFEGTYYNALCMFPAPYVSFPMHIKFRRAFYRAFKRLYDKSKTVSLPGIQCLPSISKMMPLDMIISALVADARKKVIMTDGWGIVSNENVIKHSIIIKQYFTPIQRIRSEVDSTVQHARAKADILIAVHIRQGDYQQWRDGKYYYTTAQYANFMTQAVRLFPGQIIRFLICSNEPQDQSLFKDFFYTFAPGHMISDIYSMAKCDYIIATQSTYAHWASFYGDVPTYLIANPDKTMTKKDFVIYNTLTSPTLEYE